jgi:hypothetical protein
LNSQTGNRVDERSAIALNREKAEPQTGAGPVRFGSIEILEADWTKLSDTAIVERLIAGGASRLTAERIVAIERGEAEPGRARTRTHARR